MTEDQDQAKWSIVEWHGKMLGDRNGEKISKLHDLYVDVETDEPRFATVTEGFIDRHLGVRVYPGRRQALPRRRVEHDGCKE